MRRVRRKEHRKRSKRRELEDLVTYRDDEDLCSQRQRSCRSRKSISYKFEEFDELISGAIEDDVKEPQPVSKFESSQNLKIICGKQ